VSQRITPSLTIIGVRGCDRFVVGMRPFRCRDATVGGGSRFISASGDSADVWRDWTTGLSMRLTHTGPGVAGPDQNLCM